MRPRDSCGGRSRIRDRLCRRLAATCLVVTIGCLACGLVRAQGRFSGLPLDNLQFKEAHAAYQKDEDIDDQIDNYNVWALELDLQWETDCGPCITVDHSDLCCDGEQRLHETIAEILRSADFSRRVTFIWLDIKDSGNSLVHEAWPSNRREIIRNAMLGLGADSVYTQADFDRDFAANGGRWPSWQNLRDRGKRFIVVLEDLLDPSGKEYDPVLFIAVASLEEASKIPHAAFINIKGADTSKEVLTPNDRWIHRAWFAFGTSDTDNWEAGASRGFNLVGTDDIDQGYTITDSRTHSPQPLYVNGTAFDSSRLWGTRDYPMHQIQAAVARATPGTTLVIRPGNYSASCLCDKPVSVESDSRYVGKVVIGGRMSVTYPASVRTHEGGQVKVY